MAIQAAGIIIQQSESGNITDVTGLGYDILRTNTTTVGGLYEELTEVAELVQFETPFGNGAGDFDIQQQEPEIMKEFWENGLG